MYIKYDESELFEFFECEPVPVGDDDAGDLNFTYSDNEFKLILFLSNKISPRTKPKTSLLTHDGRQHFAYSITNSDG